MILKIQIGMTSNWEEVESEFSEWVSERVRSIECIGFRLMNVMNDENI